MQASPTDRGSGPAPSRPRSDARDRTFPPGLETPPDAARPRARIGRDTAAAPESRDAAALGRPAARMTAASAAGAADTAQDSLAPARQPPVHADDPVASAKQALVERLEAWTFAPDAPPDPELGAGLDGPASQRLLQATYVDWAADLVVRRQQQFLGDPRGATPSGLRQGLYPALPSILFHSFVAGLKSSLRSPVRSAVSQALASELSIAYDATVASGAVSGVSAWTAAEIVIPAINARARLSNMPDMEAVDPKLCFPDPGPVALRFVRGSDGRTHKEFYRPLEDGESADSLARQRRAGYPSRSELLTQAKRQRHRLAVWQGTLSGKQFGTLNKPVAAGVVNALRRAGSTDAMLLTATGVLGGSLASSFVASGLTEFVQSLLKATIAGQVTVDDLAGGRLRLNAFRLVPPDPAAPIPGFRDLPQVPGVAVDALREMAALASHAFLPDWRASSDAAPRPAWNLAATAAQILGTVTANVFASVAGNATGPFFSAIVAPPGAPVPADPGDFARSPGQLAAQFASSGINELVWSHMSSGSAFGKPSLQQAQSLREFRSAVGMNRRRRMAANLRQIEVEIQREAALQRRLRVDPGVRGEIRSCVARRQALEARNERLDRAIRAAEQWQALSSAGAADPDGESLQRLPV